MRLDFRQALPALLAIALLACLALITSAHAAVSFKAATSAAVANGGANPPTTISSIGQGSAAADAKTGGIWDATVTVGATPSLPPHQPGDILICLVEAGGDAAIGSSASWTTLYSISESGHRAAAYYRVAASAGEVAPSFTQVQGRIVWWQVPSTSIIARCSGFAGVDTSNPFDPATAAASAGLGSTIATGTLTPGSSDAMLLFAAHANAARTANAPDANWNGYFVNGANLSIGLFHRSWSNTPAGPFQTTMTEGAANNQGVLLALRPIQSTPAGALTIDTPPGTAPGDVLIASVAVRPASIQVNKPDNDWIAIRTVQQGAGSSSKLVTYRRLVGASEPATHTWTFTNGSHTGAAGGIASFIGVDATQPIDDEAGQATPSGTSHTAPAVNTGFAGGMLVTSHAFASSSAWGTPAAMNEAFDIASGTPGTNGISLAMNHEARPAAGNTGTRTADAAAYPDTGATQSVALRAASMVCTSDGFNRPNGSPGSGWGVSNSGGSFGDPVIFNNRLRLTNASNNVATMATFLQLFPGAGNRIELEFEHYAYGGNGADGIAVVLSDASVPTTPGGYGGSLGYAQNTSASPTKPGFSGGWLGVGIDEFGNFSNPTEGRQGGPGLRVDSIAVRGSGSGTSGYAYHTGTAANLNPQVDNNGAASPPHRYRIILDHLNGVNAMVSVERDTGSGYQMLVAPYDAKAQPGQSTVPDNWILSWTGSTGGSTNIHEIDNLQVCATAIEPLPPIHHFDIDTGGGTGSTCQPRLIRISARDAQDAVLSSYEGTIVLSTSTGEGNWTLASGSGQFTPGAPNSGTATYTYNEDDEGVAQFYLDYDDDDTVTISAVDILLGSTVSTSESIVFDEDSLEVTITDSLGMFPIAGRPHQMRVTRYNNCNVTTNFDGHRDVAMWVTADPDHPTGATAPTVDDSDGGNAVNLPFDVPMANIANNLDLFFNDGVANFDLETTDVGKYVVNIREGSGGNTRRGSSATLTVRPWLHVAVPRNPAGSGPNDTLFGIVAPGDTVIPAGANFEATVRGVLWQSADDANNDGIPNANANLANNPAAPRFAWPVVLSVDTNTPITPAGGVIGSLANGSIAQANFSNGSATTTTLQYSEVGSFTLTALADDYLDTAALDLAAKVGPVGRFRPDRFSISAGALTNRVNAGCVPASTFTYMDEAMQMSFTLTARNANGAVTQNYAGAFAKLDPNAIAAFAIGAMDSDVPTDLSARTGLSSASGAWSNGAADIAVVASIARPDSASSPDGPYDAVALGVVATDSEGVTVPVAARNLDVNADTVNDYARINIDPARIRFGRLRVPNALGSLYLPTPLPMQVEHWNGSAFVPNTDDNCTTLDRSDFAFDNYQLYTAGSCPTAITADPITFTSGKAFAMLSAPVAGAQGSIELRGNLSTPAGQYCPGAGVAQQAASSAARSYLKGRWDDNSDGDGDADPAGYDDDPVATIRFGVYGPQAPKRFIYSRENY